MVEGRSYTSNTSKLLKQLDKLKDLQGGIQRPVMLHIAPTNRCNLECSYCCYGQRELSDELSTEQVKSALKQFAPIMAGRPKGLTKSTIGGVEWTGGGDPTMFKGLNECIEFANGWGYAQGLITNGIAMDRVTSYKKLEWMRVSLHGLNFPNKKFKDKMGANIERARAANPDIDISSTYIWTIGSEETLAAVVEFTNKYKIPTRLTPDLTLGKDSIDSMMIKVGDELVKYGSEFVFLSDFNVKTTRNNNNCYMAMVKPFVWSDGNVYVCPSIGLSPDNKLNVNDKFKVCSIDDITKQYTKAVEVRQQDCQFCKYAPQNELIEDLLRGTRHNDFA